jgi:hypothetical protein
MSARVQLLLSEEEKVRFQRAAQQQGLSLSAWLREAALERLAAERAPAGPSDRAALRAFFEACDQREEGAEPDWPQHLEVIASSRLRGASST